MFSLLAKKAIITGGGKGIGRAISELFAQQGAEVCILDVDAEGAEATRAAITKDGGKATFISCDVSDQAQTEAAFDQFCGDRLDILVNNAGVAAIGNVEHTTEADMDRVYRINIKGVYNCLLAGVKRMKAHGGAIVNMASVASMVAVPDRFAYSMTKGAVLTMTYSVAKDYIEHGIRCNCIAPARVHTPFVDGYLQQHYPGKEKEMYDTLAKTQPIGRMGKPSEIAAMALYLCSDEASFLTGTNYPIDGGYVNLNT